MLCVGVPQDYAHSGVFNCAVLTEAVVCRRSRDPRRCLWTVPDKEEALNSEFLTARTERASILRAS